MEFLQKRIYKGYNLRGLSPLFLLLISSPKLLTIFNGKFWDVCEKTYTFAAESY
jgi:hypothetical protein